MKEAIERFTPNSEGVLSDNKEKIIYINTATGMEVIYDPAGDYFRIRDTKINTKRSYVGLDGLPLPNNVKIDRGKERGQIQAEYNKETHYKNTDKKYDK